MTTQTRPMSAEEAADRAYPGTTLHDRYRREAFREGWYTHKHESVRVEAERLHRAVCESGWVGRGQMDAWHRGPEGEWPCQDIAARLAQGADR